MSDNPYDDPDVQGFQTLRDKRNDRNQALNQQMGKNSADFGKEKAINDQYAEKREARARRQGPVDDELEKDRTGKSET